MPLRGFCTCKHTPAYVYVGQHTVEKSQKVIQAPAHTHASQSSTTRCVDVNVKVDLTQVGIGSKYQIGSFEKSYSLTKLNAGFLTAKKKDNVQLFPSNAL